MWQSGRISASTTRTLYCYRYQDGQLYVLRELYVTEKDTNEIIKLADGHIPQNVVMFCDAAEPDRILMWNRAGYRAVSCEKGSGCVKAQIDWIKQRRITVDVSCTNTIAELRQYRWQKDRITGLYVDEPVSFYDDAMAALRYGVQNWRRRGEVTVKEPENRTRIQRDRISLEQKLQINRRLW